MSGGGLIETKSLFEWGGLFNLEETMVSVLHKELEYEVEKLKNKKVGGIVAEGQHQMAILGQSTRSFTVLIDEYSLSFISAE